MKKVLFAVVALFSFCYADRISNEIGTNLFDVSVYEIRREHNKVCADLDSIYNRLTGWEDIAVPLESTKPDTGNTPDFDFDNIGYLFPQNDTTEILYFSVQMPHNWDEGTTIYPGVHWYADEDSCTFKIDYKWYNINDSFPSTWTTYTMATDQVNWGDDSTAVHQVTSNSTGISGTGKTIGSILAIRLYRKDNKYTGDALAQQFNIRYKVDEVGSTNQTSK